MMTTVSVPWSEMESLLYERMEGTVNADPRMLLEVDGGPVGRKADIILARLYERDDQSVRDMRLTRVEPEILVPLPFRSRGRVDPMPDAFEMPKAARFVLQSSFAEMKMAAEYAPPWLTVGPPDFLFSVLFVRYRRRV
jgi:hypothetical protein